MKYTESQINYHCIRFDKKYSIVTTNFGIDSYPCFHIIDNSTKGSQFDCVMSLSRPVYFKNSDRLSSNCLAKLIKFLKRKNYIFRDTHQKNKWWEMILSWNASNKKQICVDRKIPQYEKLFIF